MTIGTKDASTRSTWTPFVDVFRDDDLPGQPGDPEHSWLGLMRFNFVVAVIMYAPQVG
jgi:hypothetical protein